MQNKNDIITENTYCSPLHFNYMKSNGPTQNDDLVESMQQIESAILIGGWKKTKLWWELVSLMKSPSDYEIVRRLWLASPKSCRENLSVLRAVARAACISGEHMEGRTILRKAIIIASNKKRKQKSYLFKGKRYVKSMLKKSEMTKNQNTDSFEMHAKKALHDLNVVLEDFGVKTFLISGTLLGFVRDGAIISWDKDIDVGVFSEECTENIENLFSSLSNFNVRRLDLSSDRVRVTHETGVGIDIFPHYMEGGRRWHDGAATRWWNTPFSLKKMKFLGVDQWVPDNPELYLDENYGDWRVPEPNFDARLDAPNVEITDQDYFDSLIYFALLKTIVNDKQKMKHRYISLLRQLGETTWLSRI